MRLATFNCNSIRSRMDVILRWLAEHRPDVLCLQETKVQDSEFPRGPLEDAGWHVAFRGEKAYNGVALVSRQPLSDVSFGLDGAPRDETRLACARLGKVSILNTYVPQGREIDHEMYQYKLLWFKRLRDFIEKRFSPADRVVWAGDLNVAREPQDVHDPENRANHVCYHEDVRGAFAHCCEWGFTDVFRRHHPEPGQYTFFDYRTPNAARRGVGWRIDYILASPPLAAASTDSFIDLQPRLQKQPSDHTFLVADLSVK